MSGRMIEFESNGGTAHGYLAAPEAGNAPGIVVIQEWWGLNDQIKGVADRFAAEGFAALAPDFYDGVQTAEPDEAGKLMMALNIDEAAKDMRGAAGELARRTGRPVGVIGFCMGGQLSLYAGTLAPDEIAAVVDMYGVHPAVKPDFSRMRAPVLALFGDQDDFVNEQVRTGLLEQLRAAGVQVESHVYAGAGHAFMNEQGPGYVPEASEDAWRRIVAFYRAHLK